MKPEGHVATRNTSIGFRVNPRAAESTLRDGGMLENTHTRIYINIYMYTYIHRYTYIYIYIHIYIYISTE